MSEQKSLIVKMADRYSVNGDKLLQTLKSTAFQQRNGPAPTNEQMMALLVVADQYKLNPFTKEIYAFPDKQNGIVPVVGVDGWSRIINSHPEFNGMDYRYSDERISLKGMKGKAHEWIECVMYRKDREHPTVVREYLEEVYREPFEKNGRSFAGPWQSHTNRFLRHKVTIQCARLAFGFVGIFDQDEAERIHEGEKHMGEAQVVEAIGEQDVEQIQNALGLTNLSEADLCSKAGVDSLVDIPAERLPKIISWLYSEANHPEAAQ